MWKIDIYLFSAILNNRARMKWRSAVSYFSGWVKLSYGVFVNSANLLKDDVFLLTNGCKQKIIFLKLCYQSQQLNSFYCSCVNPEEVEIMFGKKKEPKRPPRKPRPPGSLSQVNNNSFLCNKFISMLILSLVWNFWNTGVSGGFGRKL